MSTVEVESRSPNQGAVQSLLALIVAFSFVAALAVFWFVPPDYFGTYRTASQRWLSGETQLYDAQGALFWNAPWTLGLFIPFNGLPSVVGQIATNYLSVVSMMVAVAAFWNRRHFSVAILSIVNFPALFLLNNGQVDGILLVGITGGYLALKRHNPWLLSAAIVALLIKPINILIPLVLYLWSARKWSLRDWGIVVSLPAILVIASFLTAGLDWPIRYLKYVGDSQSLITWKSVITSWRAADYIGLPAWAIGVSCALALSGWAIQVKENGLTPLTLALAISTNLLFTPYAAEYHYVLLIPAFLTLAASRLSAWAIYLATFVPLVRLLGTWDISWLIIVYPLILFIFLWKSVLTDSLMARISRWG